MANVSRIALIAATGVALAQPVIATQAAAGGATVLFTSSAALPRGPMPDGRFQIQGTLQVRMADGTVTEFTALACTQSRQGPSVPFQDAFSARVHTMPVFCTV